MYTRCARVGNHSLVLGVLFLAWGAHAATPDAQANTKIPVYTVGGTVAGLAGSGLILRLNEKTDLPISANGPFTFPVFLRNGDKYTVTVAQQPKAPTQTCSVENDSGTINRASVTNVLVACASQTTTMSLTSSAPANGASDVARAASAVLTFSASLDARTATTSNVSLTGPAGPRQIALGVSANQLTITPTNGLSPITPYTLVVGTGLRGSGGETLAAPVTLAFTTVDGHWQTATELSIAQRTDAPQIAVSANGNALAVWSQAPTNDGQMRIWSDVYIAGIGWGQAQQIDATGEAVDEFDMQLAADANGNGQAVWRNVPHGNTPAPADIWSSRYTAGVGWGPPVRVETNVGQTNFPQIALDSSGNAVAVWAQSDDARIDATRFDIWTNRYRPGSGWGTPELLETATGDARDPEVAIDANGNVLAIWEQSDGSDYHIWSSYYSAGSGAWGPPQPIQSNGALLAKPQVAFDASGNALAVWRQRNAFDPFVIWSSRFSPNAGWSGSTQVNAADGHSAFFPRLAVDANGNALAVWEQSDPGAEHMWSNHFTAGVGWDTPVRIDSGTPLIQQPQVAFDSSGNGLAIWQQIDSQIRQTLSGRYVAGIGWRAPQAFDLPGAEQFGVDANGNALAVGRLVENGHWSVKVNRFE